jgi:hypothetical protein
MSEPYLVKVTQEYSDGTSTVHEYCQNPDADAIEQQVAEAVAEKDGLEVDKFIEETSQESEGE